MTTYKHIAALIIKHRKNVLNEQERKELENWCNDNEENRSLFNRLNNEAYVSDRLDEIAAVNVHTEWGRIRQMFPRKRKSRFYTVLHITKYAAVIIGLVICGTVFYRMYENSHQKNQVVNQLLHEKLKQDDPDKNRVVLKLANSRIVYLDSSLNGHIALQHRAVISKQGNLVRYDWSTGDGQPDIGYNTLITPQERTFSIMLPDGSKVWMNAGSSITYPTAFTGAERRVAITGEAYFEVQPFFFPNEEGKKIPFVVDIFSAMGAAGNKVGEVEVLGTRFNIDAYNDEPAVTTTLLEGSVKVVNRQSAIGNRQSANNKHQLAISPFAILKPGEQAAIFRQPERAIHNGILVQAVNVNETIAWINDQFKFREQDIKQVMAHIGRWYNYQVVYQEPVTGHYTLTISRKATVSDVLKRLEMAGGVQFKTEGNRIIVMQERDAIKDINEN